MREKFAQICKNEAEIYRCSFSAVGQNIAKAQKNQGFLWFSIHSYGLAYMVGKSKRQIFERNLAPFIFSYLKKAAKYGKIKYRQKLRKEG